jgi:subtilisin-like proprotein convertase family protein
MLRTSLWLVLLGAIVAVATPAFAGPDMNGPATPRTLLKGTVNANVPEDDPMQTTSSIASLGNGRLVAVYFDREHLGGTGSATGYSYSTDNGKTWTDGGVLHSQPFAANYPPAIAAFPAKNTVYVASSGNGDGTVAVRKSIDGGKTWGPAVDASNGASQTTYQQIAVDTFDGSGKGNVYLCYTASPGTLMAARSTDAGNSFPPSGQAALAVGPIISPCGITVGPNHHVYVFYVKDDGSGNHFLYMRKSTDRGLTYVAPVAVSPVSTDQVDAGQDFNSQNFDGILQPQVAINPDPKKPWIYVTFADIADKTQQGKDVNTYVVYSRNGGTTWSSRVSVDTGTGDQFAPGIAFASPGNLMVGYYTNSDDLNAARVYHRRARIGKLRKDGSIRFNPSFQLGPNTPWVFQFLQYVTVSYFDKMDGRGGKWFTTWADSRHPNQFFENQPDIHFASINASSKTTDLRVKLHANKTTLLPLDSAKVTATVSALDGAAEDAFVNVVMPDTMRLMQPFGADCWEYTDSNSPAPGDPYEFSSLGCALGTIAKGKSKNVTFFVQTPKQSYGDETLEARVTTSRRDTRLSNNTAKLAIVSDDAPKNESLSTGNIASVISNVVSPVEIPIIVSTTGTVLSVTASLRLNHENDADLDIYLVDPLGNGVELSTDNGGTGNDYGTGTNDCSGTPTSFGDSSGISIVDGTAPFTGSYEPEEPLSNFIGNAMAGTWKLKIIDDAAVNSGVIGCFQLTLGYK